MKHQELWDILLSVFYRKQSLLTWDEVCKEHDILRAVEYPENWLLVEQELERLGCKKVSAKSWPPIRCIFHSAFGESSTTAAVNYAIRERGSDGIYMDFYNQLQIKG
jgi:hypothetical protein